MIFGKSEDCRCGRRVVPGPAADAGGAAAPVRVAELGGGEDGVGGRGGGVVARVAPLHARGRGVVLVQVNNVHPAA